MSAGTRGNTTRPQAGASGWRDWVAEVKQHVRILDVVAPYTQLKSAGGSYRGPCPLHGGEGPNFAVMPQRNAYKCFVCDAGGDAFSFLMQKEGLSFMDAAKRLAAMVGVEVPTARPRKRSAAEQARSTFQGVLAAGTDPSLWEALELQALVEPLGLGTRVSPTGSRLLLPLTEVPGATPTGWLTYTLGGDAEQRVVPIRVGLDGASDPAAIDTLFVPTRFRQALIEQECLLVDDPIAACWLLARGYGAVVAPVQWGTTGTGEDGLLSARHIEQLAALGVERVTMVMPWGATREERQVRLRALYATEPALLARGIEPLVLLPSPEGLDGGEDTSGAVDSWGWLAALEGGVAALPALLASPERTVDLFQLRVAQVSRIRRKSPAKVSLDVAVAKLRPSLLAAQTSGDRALADAYMAWAARALNLRDLGVLAALVDPSAGPADAEVF